MLPCWRFDETRRYLLDVQRLLEARPGPRQFFDEMRARHPDRINPGPLWYSAVALLGRAGAGGEA